MLWAIFQILSSEPCRTFVRPPRPRRIELAWGAVGAGGLTGVIANERGLPGRALRCEPFMLSEVGFQHRVAVVASLAEEPL
jgi:hypothetical protein